MFYLSSFWLFFFFYTDIDSLAELQTVEKKLFLVVQVVGNNRRFPAEASWCTRYRDHLFWALMPQTTHGPLWTSSSIFVPFIAPPVFYFWACLSQRRSLSFCCRPPACTSWLTGSCLSVWSSKAPLDIFLCSFHWDLGEIWSILSMDSTVNNPRTLDMPRESTLSVLTSLLLRSGCSDTSHRICQECFCTSAAVYSCRPPPHWI